MHSHTICGLYDRFDWHHKQFSSVMVDGDGDWMSKLTIRRVMSNARSSDWYHTIFIRFWNRFGLPRSWATHTTIFERCAYHSLVSPDRIWDRFWSQLIWEGALIIYFWSCKNLRGVLMLRTYRVARGFEDLVLRSKVRCLPCEWVRWRCHELVRIDQLRLQDLLVEMPSVFGEDSQPSSLPCKMRTWLLSSTEATRDIRSVDQKNNWHLAKEE